MACAEFQQVLRTSWPQPGLVLQKGEEDARHKTEDQQCSDKWFDRPGDIIWADELYSAAHYAGNSGEPVSRGFTDGDSRWRRRPDNVWKFVSTFNEIEYARVLGSRGRFAISWLVAINWYRRWSDSASRESSSGGDTSAPTASSAYLHPGIRKVARDLYRELPLDKDQSEW